MHHNRSELPAILRFDPLPMLSRGWYLARVDVRQPFLDSVAVLVHELSHILLWHLARKAPRRVYRTSRDATSYGAYRGSWCRPRDSVVYACRR